MAIELNGSTGITTPGLINTGSETVVNLTTSGNTILGDASTDTLNVGNGGLVKDASGNVGIGTGTPTTSLTVNRNASFTGTPSSPIAGGGIHVIGADSASLGIHFDTFSNNSQITFRRANGTLVTPTALTTDSILGAVTWRGYGATGYSSGNRGLIQLNAAENWTDSAQGTYLQFNTVAVGTTTSAEKMRLDSSGNLGVGTTSPTTRLETSVSNPTRGIVSQFTNSAASGQTGAQITLNQVNVDTWTFGMPAGTSAFSFWNSRSPSADGTAQMTLNNLGNLTVGTATSGSIYMMNYTASTIGTRLGANPSDQTFTLNTRNGVAGSGSGTEIARLCWGYNGTDSAYISAERNGGTGANRINVVCNASAGVFLAAGGTSWGSLSDERQKTNLEPITDASNKLNTLRTVTGRYITDEETISRAFLIAQDVQAVLPEAVDAQEDEDGTLGLRYTDLIPLLIAGFKEQQATIDELKAKVAALEAA